MIAVIIACAGLCALICLWVFKPLRTPRLFYGAAFACAIASLGFYMLLGSPELPDHPAPKTSEARDDMRRETEFMQRLEKDPNDADAMIRLAALRLVQGRDNTETLRLLDKADAIKPNDRRVKVIRSMIAYPNPTLKDK